jgi:hypothetical protein
MSLIIVQFNKIIKICLLEVPQLDRRQVLLSDQPQSEQLTMHYYVHKKIIMSE